MTAHHTGHGSHTARRTLAISLAVLAALAALYLLLFRQRTLRVDLEPGTIGYVDCYYGGMPRRLSNPAHAAALDDLTEMLRGEYRSVRTLRLGDSSGGPVAIRFYRADGTLAASVAYWSDYLCVETGGQYRLYQKTGGTLSFDEFEAYLVEHGEFV